MISTIGENFLARFLDHGVADAAGDRPGPSIRAHRAVVEALLPFQAPEVLLAQVALRGGERRGLAAPGWFTYLAHMRYMKVEEVDEGLEAGDGPPVRLMGAMSSLRVANSGVSGRFSA